MLIKTFSGKTKTRPRHQVSRPRPLNFFQDNTKSMTTLLKTRPRPLCPRQDQDRLSLLNITYSFRSKYIYYKILIIDPVMKVKGECQKIVIIIISFKICTYTLFGTSTPTLVKHILCLSNAKMQCSQGDYVLFLCTSLGYGTQSYHINLTTELYSINLRN